jgi:hypothetical protein
MTISTSDGTICPDRDSLAMIDNSKRIRIPDRRASVEGAILSLLVLALVFLAVGYY